MKAYTTVTGVIFGLIGIAHVWRIVRQGSQLGKGSGFVLMTVVAFGLSAWAFGVLWSARRR